MKKFSVIALAIFGLASFSAQAGVAGAEQAAKDYAAHAKHADPKFTPTVEAGRAFFIKKVVVDGKDMSCSTCHTDNPANKGEHADTHKPIKPLAPSANPERFSDRGKSEKAFTKHCRDLYKKDCAPQDKADYVTYLLSVK